MDSRIQQLLRELSEIGYTAHHEKSDNKLLEPDQSARLLRELTEIVYTPEEADRLKYALPEAGQSRQDDSENAAVKVPPNPVGKDRLGSAGITRLTPRAT
jgi:hypothetical protein